MSARAARRAYSDAYETGRVFTLRIPPQRRGEPAFMIHAYDATCKRGVGPHGHTPLDIEVTQGGKPVFPRGELYVGIPSGHCIDTDYAKEAVLSCVAMKPGDTDPDYFDGYTEAQLEWARANGEYLSLVALERYGER